MRLITRRRLLAFASAYPDTQEILERWFRSMKLNEFQSFSELRQVFPGADQVDYPTVFNIGGNKFRLIAAIPYNRGIFCIRQVLTHEEYDKGKWKA